MLRAIERHWPEYLMEAAGLGLFMISACAFAALLEHPDSPVRQSFTGGFVRRVIMGLAMGLTAVGIIYSPWGQRSGAHINPAITLTFYRLGKIESWDAAFYVLFHFLGGVSGVFLAQSALSRWIAHPNVNYAVTVPGHDGEGVAFVAEAFISLALIFAVLSATNSERWARFTGVLAGVLVATYITFEAPLSGMSMNPARSFGSAFFAHWWAALWIYFTAPPLGMLIGAEMYLRLRGAKRIVCAKLHHQNSKPCIFRCGYAKAGKEISCHPIMTTT